MYIETFYSPQHALHAPPFELYAGERQPYMDSPQRLSIILGEIQKLGNIKVYEPKEQPIELIERVHDQDYINFLRNFSKTNSAWLFPSIFPISVIKPEAMEALLGCYSFETSTPVGPDTFKAAKASADVAITAAQEIIRGQSVVYALCRPPGHHSEARKMGGYCYFNNAALAIAQLADHGKVALLDLDAHHCNGTQSIFYDRSDVFTVSIHGDPSYSYPYFTGYSNETGVGDGVGYNLNFPVNPQLMDDSCYDDVLKDALSAIKLFAPNYLVLSMGFDTHKDDPGADFQLTTDYYEQIGDRVKHLNYPTLIVQEGGYKLDTLGLSAASLLRGFKQNKIIVVNH